MLQHQQRLVEERNELLVKTAKLYDFIDDENPVWGKIDPAEKKRMKRQHEHMIKYAKVLDERIAAFTK